MTKKAKTKKDCTAPFTAHGIDFREEKGEEKVGGCPFCGARTKFYANMENGLWCCKAGSCDMSGNAQDFLEYYWKKCKEDTTTKDLSVLTALRKGTVSVKFLKKAGVAWDGSRFLIPVRSANSRMRDLRIYSNGQVISTTGVTLGLFGLERAKKLKVGGVVVVCEGEFDALALWEWLDNAGLGNKFAVVSVPGAGTFKTEWGETLKGREVWLAYDADTAGQKGCDRAIAALDGFGCTLKRVAWPVQVEKGYDVTDWVRQYVKPSQNGAGKPKDALGTLKAWRVFKKMLVPCGSRDVPGMEEREYGRPFAVVVPGKPITYKKMMKSFDQWLHVTPEIARAIRVALAVAFSNWLKGDPVWVMLVGPAGSCKSEILMSLSGLEQVIAVSSLSPKGLVSGFLTRDGHDPSLLARMNNKVMVVKDWTEILGLHSQAQEEIYSVMRGAYDGTVERLFGNGVERKYITHFTALAGCTPAIYASKQASLGERFLKYHMQKGVGFNSDNAILSAMDNLNQELEMRGELREQVAAFFLNFGDAEEKIRLPALPKWAQTKLVALSQLSGMARGVVQRDFRGENIEYRAQHESATRLAKQASKLLLSLAMIKSPDFYKTTKGGGVGPTLDSLVTEEDYEIVERVVLDSAYSFQMDALITIGELGGKIGFQEIQEKSGIAATTLARVLEDCMELGIVKRVGMARAYAYELSPRMKYLFRVANLKNRTRALGVHVEAPA